MSTRSEIMRYKVFLGPFFSAQTQSIRLIVRLKKDIAKGEVPKGGVMERGGLGYLASSHGLGGGAKVGRMSV